MSELKLNLVDAKGVISGTIHGSVAERCLAALSAEPETISELEAALARYMKPREGEPPFSWFRHSSELDEEPYDSGIVIIDLASRVVAAESSYFQPEMQGAVDYHDGTAATDTSIHYCLPGDWLFVNSLEAYRWSAPRHRERRRSSPPIDARAVLYGPPLLEYIANSEIERREKTLTPDKKDEEAAEQLVREIVRTHANWLMMPREDLRGRSPRTVLLEKRHQIDCDMDSRALQWSFLGEGPPCLARDSFAYRYAGFGTHEWVVYYDLVRHLLQKATELDFRNLPSAMDTLKEIELHWLETGDGEYELRTPANIIENERRRLPQVASAAEFMFDEDCDCCRMLAQEAEMGFGPTFWHLDGSHMEDEFAFSTCLTVEEWEAENRRREEFDRQFEGGGEELRQRLISGESIEPDEIEAAGAEPF